MTLFIVETTPGVAQTKIAAATENLTLFTQPASDFPKNVSRWLRFIIFLFRI